MGGNIEKLLYNYKQNKKRLLAVLLDTDSWDGSDISGQIDTIHQSGAGLILVGGSLMLTHHLDSYILEIKKHTRLPVVIFPGNSIQISRHADGLLFLSLISGRNPEFLIGQQVTAAPLLKNSNLEILPTGYILIDGGKETTVSYISGSKPIPRDKPGIAAATALAGYMLGQRIMYMDAGSGARLCIPEKTIQSVTRNIPIPLIAGGGINKPEDLEKIYIFF
jgi:putative glycerol-1-phosphate prenyltransferase